MRFADESRGWILGHQGTLYSTTDKGLRWSQRSASEAVVSAQLSERGEVVSRLLARPNDRLEIKGDEVSVIDGTTLFSVSGEQVRYLAMRQRVTANNYSDSKLTPGSGDGLIPESILVALASLQHVNPEWIEDDEQFMQISEPLRPHAISSDSSKELLQHSVAKHIQEFGNWAALAECRKAYLQMCATVRVR